MVPDLNSSIPNKSNPQIGSKAVISREIQISYPNIIRIYMVPIDAPVNSDGGGGYVVVLTDITEKSIT